MPGQHIRADQPLIAHGLGVIYGSVICVIILLTLADNVFMWVAILRTKSLHTDNNALLLCLSCTDILMALASMPVTAYNLFMGRNRLPDTVCLVSARLFYIYINAAVLMLTVMTVNRYLRFCHYDKYATCCGRTGIVVSVAGVWLLSTVYVVPFFNGWYDDSYNSERLLCIGICTASSYICIIKFTAMMLIPFLIIAVCYQKIFRQFEIARNKVKAALEYPVLDQTWNARPSDRKNSSTQSIPEKDTRRSSSRTKTDVREDRTVKGALLAIPDKKTPKKTDKDEETLQTTASAVLSKESLSSKVDFSSDVGNKRATSKVSTGQSQSKGDTVSGLEDRDPADKQDILTTESHCDARRGSSVEVNMGSTTSFLTYTLPGVPHPTDTELHSTMSLKPARQTKSKVLKVLWHFLWRDSERKAVTSIGLIITVFIISHFPAVILVIAIEQGAEVPLALAQFFYILLYANSFYNPIIYGARNPNVRAAYRQLWKDITYVCRR